MQTLAWQPSGMHIIERPYSTPTMSGAALASHLMEHPIDYDGSPESMLLTLGASLWVRGGQRFYLAEREGLRFEDVITEQLGNVIAAMVDMGRMIKPAPERDRLDDETEDMIWSILVRASADDHVLTGNEQIVPLAGWLRAGIALAVQRWNTSQTNVCNAFLSAADGIQTLIEKHAAGAHPPHRRWHINIRAQRGVTRIEACA